MIRVYNEQELRARLHMPQLIEAMQAALVAFSSGDVTQPVRTVFPFGGASWFGSMPCYVPSLPALGAKLVTLVPENAARGIDTHQATIVLLDPATGVLSAILDGRYITEVRTAAVSAVSARLLASEASRVLALIGSGVQARSHLEALRLVRDFDEVRVWSPTAERREKFAAEFGLRAVESAEAAVRGADVVACLTPATEPVIRNEWITPGTHVIAVGSCAPHMRELPGDLVARARLIVDSRAAALKEAGDVVRGISDGAFGPGHIEAELGELPRRRTADEVTIFKSLGLAVEDVFAAHLALS